MHKSTITGKAILIILVALIFGWFQNTESHAQKTDKMLLTTGDLITGEIKKLDYGKVTFKTTPAGTMSVKWENIYKMYSNKNFEIWLSRGLSYQGSFDTTDTNYELKIVTEDSSHVLNMNRIVEFSQLKSRFWARLDGSIDLGYQFTKGSEVTQLNGDFRIEYKAQNSLLTTSANLIITRQPERDDSRKQDIDLNYRYLLARNFATMVFTSAQQNTELGNDLRLSIGAGMSKNWIKSNSQRLFTTLGALVNQERSTGSEDVTKNLEGIMQLEYRAFRYRDPEMDITSTFILLPSFTVAGRYRTDLNTKIRFEIFSDFFIGLTFYHNLDTKPPGDAPASSDWGIVTSFGYSF